LYGFAEHCKARLIDASRVSPDISEAIGLGLLTDATNFGEASLPFSRGDAYPVME